MPLFRKKSPPPATPINSPPLTPAEHIRQKLATFHPRTKDRRALAASSSAIALSIVSTSRDPTDLVLNEPGSSKESGWVTAYEAAMMAVEIADPSSDMFLPLKAVVGALSVLLKNCDQFAANAEQVGDIEKRVQSIAEVLTYPVSDQDGEEKARREGLRGKLAGIVTTLTPLSKQHGIARFLKNDDHAKILNGFVQDLAYAVTDYQTSLQQSIYRGTQLVDETTHRIDETTKNLIGIGGAQNIIGSADLVFLKKLEPVYDAGYQAGHHDTCLRGTRESVLDEIMRWAKDPQDRHVFWLNGPAGTGKSTIAQTFSEMVAKAETLGASFFCSRDYLGRRVLKNIFPTLAYQLACRYPAFRSHVIQAIKRDPAVARKSLIFQLQGLIVGPLSSSNISCVIVVDALDECIDDQPASAILSVLSRHAKQLSHAKFFITGRPEPRIRTGFRLPLLEPLTQILLLHKVKPSSVNEDIKIYLRTHLTNIRKQRDDCEFPEEWPSSYDLNFLCRTADGIFIYASTVVRFVESEHHLPTERLDLVLSSRGTAHEGGAIDLLYTQILRQASQAMGSGGRQFYPDFRNVIGAVVLVFGPLSRKGLEDLLGISSHSITVTLRHLHPLFNFPLDMDGPIRVLQRSFTDFLTDRTRCKDEWFFIDPPTHHENILFSCLKVMRERLKRNICDLDNHMVLREVEGLSTRMETSIGNSLEYACQFWTKHLARIPGHGPHAKRVQEAIDDFFAKRLLCWIEVLSIMGRLGAAAYAINDIRQWYISAGISTFYQADDSERFILEYFDAIRDSPSQIYHSALTLSPSSSWVRECYKEEVPGEVEVLMGLPDRWDTCSRTIFLEGKPSALAYWGNTIAVGLESDVVLLDAVTGSMTSALFGHGGIISSIAFSLDGTRLASSGKDRTVKFWDVETSEVIKTFDTSSVSSVSVAPDLTTIASGTWDGAICLWNTRTGACHSIETGQTDVSVVSFSPVDSRRFISSSLDGTVRQWDVDGHQIGTSYPEADRVDDLVYAPDGTRFISCGGKVATIRDSESGAVVARLDAPDGVSLYRCCFSPDGKFVACAADTTIWVWDITIPGAPLVGRLAGHTDTITFLTFSSSLISGSRDQSVKFWQSSGFLPDSTMAGHTAALHGSTPIVSANLFAKDGTVVTSDESGVVNTWDLTTGERKTSSLTPAKGIQDTHLAGETLIVVWWMDEEKQYHIWDVGKSQLLRKVYSLLSEVSDLKIAGDGSKIFGVGDGRIEARSTQSGKYVGGAWLEGGIGSSLTVYGSKVECGSKKGWGWDFGGLEASDFGELPDRPRLDVVDRSDGRVRSRWIEDTVTKRRVFHLSERYTKSGTEVGWDGRYLLVWSRSGEVLVIDFDPSSPRWSS